MGRGICHFGGGGGEGSHPKNLLKGGGGVAWDGRRGCNFFETRDCPELGFHGCGGCKASYMVCKLNVDVCQGH